MTIQQAMAQAKQHQLAGRFADAKLLCQKIVEVQPDNAAAWHMLALSSHELNDLNLANVAIQRAVVLLPDSGMLRMHAGQILAASGRHGPAIVELEHALAIAPNLVDAHIALGNSQQAIGHYAEAIAVFQKVLAARPENLDAQFNLANALRLSGNSDAAIAEYRKTIALQPTHISALNNLGNLFHELGRFDDAILSFRHAISEARDHPPAHYNLGVTLLLTGDLEQGFAEYDWRRRESPEAEGACISFPQPMWTGEALAGRRILLHAEQGFGDTIMFARYAPLVAGRGGDVILQCQPALARLMKSIHGISKIIPAGDALPEFDLHCPLLSLPMVFNTSLDSIPANNPYLQPDPADLAVWNDRMKPIASPRVGLAWAGSAAHANDINRSIPAELLAPLAKVDNVQFVSLQKDNVRKVSPPIRVRDFTNDLPDFADTAALLANLDLIITVDTAVAHLAGAMGKPVWVLLPHVPDWRWLLNRNDSPWYPTMKLFRQPSRGDWGTPIQVIVQLLLQQVQSSALVK
jgi:tetratricopeptide (TPR) repeat protein